MNLPRRSWCALARVLVAGLLAGSLSGAKPAPAPAPAGVPDDVRRHIDQGSHALAESLARTALRETETSGDSLRIAAASDLVFESLFAQGRGGRAEATSLARRSERIHRASLGTHDATYAISLRNLARSLPSARVAEMDSLLLEALAIQERALGRNHLEVAGTLWNLSRLASTRGDHERAAERARRCLAIREKLLPPDDPRVLRARAQLGRAYASWGDADGARIQVEQILTVIRKRPLPPHAEVAQNLHDLGAALYGRDRPDLARPILESALEQRSARLGPRRLETAATMLLLGQVCARQVDYTRARALYDSCLAIRRDSLGLEHASTASILVDIGELEWSTSAPDSARAHLDRAVAIYEKAYGAESANFAGVLRRVAWILSDTADDPDGSVRLHRRRMGILERNPGQDSLALAGAMIDLARVLRMKEELAEARLLCDRGLAIRERAQGPEHLDVGYTVHLRGMILRDQREFEPAVRCFERHRGLAQEHRHQHDARRAVPPRLRPVLQPHAPAPAPGRRRSTPGCATRECPGPAR